jgi:hypothetical protein
MVYVISDLVSVILCWSKRIETMLGWSNSGYYMRYIINDHGYKSRTFHSAAVY